MESNEPEEKCSNTKTGDETIALEKRRSKSRRVSFAETTAIHLFIRDEECETPPEVEGSSNGKLHRSESDEIRELLSSDSEESDHGGGGVDVDGNAVESSFLVRMESPSPGKDNFFGPVSAEFIKPGRLSDSAASDENHDVTMDSTAFSMHFRSLVKSDSGGEFKTPTGVHLEFGERTSGQVSSTTSGGDSMVLTASRKRVAGSLLADVINNSGNSDDMSVVGENPRRYDYGELPPDLDVLLAEDGKDVGAVSQTSNMECSNTLCSFKVDAGSGLHQNGLELLDLNNRDVDAHHVSDCAVSAANVNIDNKNECVPLPHATLGETTKNKSKIDDDMNDQTKTSMRLTNVMPVDKDEEVRKGSVEASGKFLSSPLVLQSDLGHEQQIAGSVSSSLGKHTQTFRGSPSVKSNLFGAEKKYSDKGRKHVLSASSFEKGISRLKRLEGVLFASASKAEGHASKLLPPESITSSLTRNNFLKYGSKATSTNFWAAPVACLDTHFSRVAMDDEKLRSKAEVCRYDLRCLGDAQCAIHPQIKDAEQLSPSAASCPHDKSTGTSVSPLALHKDKRLETFGSRDSHSKETILSAASDCSLLGITYTDSKYNRETGIPGESAFSLETSAERKVSASPLYEGSLFKNLNLQAESSFRLDPDMKQKKADNFTPRSDSTSTLLIEGKEEAMSSTSDIEHSKIVIQEMQNDESMLKKHHKASKSLKPLVSSANVDSETLSTTTLPVSESPKENLCCTLLHKKPCFTDDANVHCFDEDTVLTPRSYQPTSKHDEDDRCLVKPSNICGSNVFSSLKRKLFDKAGDHIDESASFQRKPKSCKDQNQRWGGSNVPNGSGGDATQRDWVDIQVRQLGSRVEESKMLISSCLDSCIHDLADAQINCFSLVNPSKMSLVAAEIPLLHKELEVSDRQIRNFSKPFNDYIKVPEELTCTETTVHVKHLLRRRVACRSVQSECQLCQIGSVKVMQGKPSILFDHGGIVSQRFIVKSISTYGLFISNTINNVKISKMFPGMDACIAFSFTSCGHSNLAYSGFRTIAQETQKTISLLHSVLDVVEEVELAMLELRNLTDSRFLQPSAGKLDLRLCFTDFKSGATVSLTIDITCLKRGIYPSQVLPYEVQGKATSRYESFQSLLDNIKNAVRGVRTGYMRIIGLCRCVSRMIQTDCIY
ncbi:Orotate phosphoribosyltransferase [Bienertia sinuspersici]